MMNNKVKNGLGVVVIVAVAALAGWAVQHNRRPGQLDVISAQAMDMSQMRPPTGAAPVALAAVRQGSLASTVTYTGTIRAYSEQDISARITGMLLSLPLYPGDLVRAGQTVARLDTAEIGAKAEQATQEARQAQIGAQVAHLTHHLHHQAALDQAAAQVDAARQSVADAQAEAQADQAAIADAQAGVRSAQASTDYWKTEIVREKQLADAGAASQQEYQNELAQAQSAAAMLSQALAKVGQARAVAMAARAKTNIARHQVTAAQAGVRMAEADIAVAQGQATQAEAVSSAAMAAARVASVEQGYAHLTSPFDGIVTARPVAAGTLVQPGTVLLKVAQIDRVRVQANVSVSDLAGIHVGSPVQIAMHNDGTSKTIPARVSAVFPAASDATRTALVEAVITNRDHRLLPGAFVTIQITKATVSDKLMVPASAVVTQSGQSFVWVVSGGATVGHTYECVVCHIHYTAAQAARFHYKDPMEGGRLVPLKRPRGSTASGAITARRVPVQTGASDGAWTEINSPPLVSGTQVVTHGQAGLTDGAQIVATAWGADGPKSLPTAASVSQGQTLYRCEKCGMTYSAADAQRNHFVDPMDGGRLVPVRGR